MRCCRHCFCFRRCIGQLKPENCLFLCWKVHVDRIKVSQIIFIWCGKLNHWLQGSVETPSGIKAAWEGFVFNSVGSKSQLDRGSGEARPKDCHCTCSAAPRWLKSRCLGNRYACTLRWILSYGNCPVLKRTISTYHVAVIAPLDVGSDLFWRYYQWFYW